MKASTTQLQTLRDGRRRSLFVGFSFALLLLGALGAWIYLMGDMADWFTEKRVQNFERFLGEIRPWPVQDGKGWPEVGPWLSELWRTQGRAGLAATFLIAVVAAVLAGGISLLTVPTSSRTLARAEPFRGEEIATSRGWPSRLGWSLVRFGSRAFNMLMRALPEMILAFVLVSILGFGPWAAVLALALHNAGVLGRLSAELVENADDDSARALWMQGAGRRQVYLFALLPEVMNRFLVFFFYRWETCVREATVLGLLGIASLGAFIGEARARLRYDEMLFLILLGAMLVVVGDLVSSWLRRRLNPPPETW